MSETEVSPTVRAIRAIKAEVLREAAEGWGDGVEGFAYQWLLDRADEIEQGKIPNWDAEW